MLGRVRLSERRVVSQRSVGSVRPGPRGLELAKIVVQCFLRVPVGPELSRVVLDHGGVVVRRGGVDGFRYKSLDSLGLSDGRVPVRVLSRVSGRSDQDQLRPVVDGGAGGVRRSHRDHRSPRPVRRHGSLVGTGVGHGRERGPGGGVLDRRMMMMAGNMLRMVGVMRNGMGGLGPRRREIMVHSQLSIHIG